jgi:hypothetical protein
MRFQISLLYGFQLLTRLELETNRVLLAYPLPCHALPCFAMSDAHVPKPLYSQG